MKEKIAFTVVIVAVLIGIFFLIQHNDIPISTDLTQKEIIQNDTIYLNIDFSKINSTKEDFLKNIPSYDIKNKEYMDHNYAEDNSLIKDYLSFHLNEFTEKEFVSLGMDNVSQENNVLLYQKLKLINIWLYPIKGPNDQYYLVFDYSIGKKYADAVIVIKTDLQGNFIDINWES
ncbi:DUF2004 domain-containing protein [Myroides sp. N17-2]|uniref:DUF2004 domain-containing protein n=1 Tax=Myroides sp. N17-2 TaxID=2030799 RepID=UPI000EFCAB26|nr:DUF2004 domain-containing protein [Myroides sp. N17-2]